MQDHSGKVVLVTGASRGIGKAIAVGMAGFGYDVVLTDIAREREALDAVKAEIAATGRRAFAFTADVSREAEIQRLVADALKEAGRIDVLVNNAGILAPSLLQDLGEASWDAHFDVNTKGVWIMCKAALPHMRARKSGRIVNIASIAGRQGVPTQGHYAATKAAVITLTRVFAQEVGMDGITVNAVCPGIILTEMGKNNLGSTEAIRHWEGVTALKRLGQPEDVVGTVYFFASDLADFVTGQALNVDGGIYYH